MPVTHEAAGSSPVVPASFLNWVNDFRLWDFSQLLNSGNVGEQLLCPILNYESLLA